MFKSYITISLAVTGANAFWRMECPGRLDVGRIDPIVNFNDVSAHAHALHGSGGLSESSSTAELLAADCTSCRVTEDKSGYWHPPLYFQDANTKKFELVPQVGGMLAYYLLYGENITAFPTDFRMISGNTKRRTYTLGDPSQPDPDKSRWAAMGQTKQEDLEQRAVGFNCLNYDKAPEGTLYRHYLPDKAYLDANCKDGIRFEMMFPSCWDGVNTDSTNHKSHVAFPDLVMTGNCPSGYETRLPSLMYEVIWNVAAFSDRQGRFVISNGDATGFGYHADFMMGWKEGLLQNAVETCTNPSGLISDCPLFTVVDEAEATSCKLQNSLPQILSADDVEGPVARLPGNVKITNGDGSADDNDDTPLSSSAVAKPTLSYKPGELPSNSASPLPGQIFKEKGKLSSSSSVPPAPATTSKAPAMNAAAIAPTTTSAPPPPASTDTNVYSTQYVTNGNVVSEILWAEIYVTVTDVADVTATVTSTPLAPVKHKRRSHLHGHARRSH